MSKFIRRFEARDWDAFPVVRTLLDCWKLPGEASDSDGLRLALRNGYANFYRKGQSVAKLHSTATQVKLEIHKAYVARRRKPESRGEALVGYDRFDEAWLSDPANCAHVADWIDTAGSYAGSEKSIVDELIAANPGTIDIEIGLPAYDGEKSAPRMDLVLVEGGNRIAFWEAKCTDNAEIRARAEPHVVQQVPTYEEWMAKPGRAADVVAAYRDAAAIMVELATAAGKPDSSALASWRALRDAGEAMAIGRPGVVIGGYCPDGFTGRGAELIAARAQSFEARGHRSRLVEKFGLTLACYASADEVKARPLPPLAGAAR